MVYFVADSRSIQEATSNFSEGYPELAGIARFIEYSQLLSLNALPSGSYIFAGTVDFDDDRRELSILVERHMRQQGDQFRVFNSPLQSGTVSDQFKTCFAGILLCDARIKIVHWPRTVQPIYRLGHREVAEDSDELPLYIAELVLRGLNPQEIGLFESLEEVSHLLVYSSLCMKLDGPTLVCPTIPSAFSLDVFSLEVAVVGGKEGVIAISDRLTDILPPTKSGSSLSQAITSAVLELNTVRTSDPALSRWNWQSLGASLGLRNPA